jgi:hypothetical protein
MNEYLNTKEVSEKHSISTRNVRRIATLIEPDLHNKLLFKNKLGEWSIHYSLLAQFTPQRTRKEIFYALTIDPVGLYSEQDIKSILKYIIDEIEDDIEFNYVIEAKTANNKNHIHAYVKTKNKRNLIKAIRTGFGSISFHDTPIYDLEGWKSYIKKQGAQIQTLKK